MGRWGLEAKIKHWSKVDQKNLSILAALQSLLCYFLWLVPPTLKFWNEQKQVFTDKAQHRFHASSRHSITAHSIAVFVVFWLTLTNTESETSRPVYIPFQGPGQWKTFG